MPTVRSLLLPQDRPKGRVNLHCHLEGAIKIETISELARKKGICISGSNSVRDVSEFVTLTHPKSLKEFIKRIDTYIPLIKGDREAIERVSYELCETQALDSVCYFELRYSPHLLSSTFKFEADGQASSSSYTDCDKTEEMTPEMTLTAVLSGLERGKRDFGIDARVILCAIRTLPATTSDLLELCIKYRDQGVVAIDLAGPEAANDLHPFKDFYDKAARLGIHRTCHASETGFPENLRYAYDVLRCERVGHGCHVLKDKALYSECIKSQLHFELCPISNYYTSNSYLEYPLINPVVQFAKDGVNFSINTDDPTVLRNSLEDEYKYLRKMGLSEVYFTRANLNAARSAFLEDGEKKKLLNYLYNLYGFSTNADDDTKKED